MNPVADKITINVPDTYTGEKPIQVELRAGEALELKDNEQAYEIEGLTLKSINEYVEKRKFETDPKENKAVVEFSKDPKSPFVFFKEDPRDKEANQLKAKLLVNPDITAWSINTKKRFTPEDFITHIMQYSFMFHEKAAGKALIDNLRNFQVRYESEYEKEDNRQGNTKDNSTKVLKFIKGEAPKQLQITAPLYKGTEDVTLTLDIEIDAVNGQPQYSFYCFELQQLYIDKAKDYIEQTVNPLRSKFVCLEK